MTSSAGERRTSIDERGSERGKSDYITAPVDEAAVQ
jgi:hypothetical protein